MLHTFPTYNDIINAMVTSPGSVSAYYNNTTALLRSSEMMAAVGLYVYINF